MLLRLDELKSEDNDELINNISLLSHQTKSYDSPGPNPKFDPGPNKHRPNRCSGPNDSWFWVGVGKRT